MRSIKTNSVPSSPLTRFFFCYCCVQLIVGFEPESLGTIVQCSTTRATILGVIPNVPVLIFALDFAYLSPLSQAAQ